MVSMIRQYPIYTAKAVYSAWGHNSQEALDRVQKAYPDEKCSVIDNWRAERLKEQALDDLLWGALPYLMLLQRLRGSDNKFISFDGDKGYWIDLTSLGDLDALIREIAGEGDVPTVDESLREM